MTLLEIKSKVYAKQKNMNWFLGELPFSHQYFYRELARANERVIEQVKSILNGL